MKLREQERRLLMGFLRVFVVVVLTGVVMKILGYYEEDKWILKLNMAVLPWYFVYKIYIQPAYRDR